jgi:tRNA modification GTPase
MPAQEDTIFALSSGAPPAAIAIIRISGPSAFAAVKALCGRVPAPRRASLLNLRDPAGGGVLDQALVLTFSAPNTATGEDLAELHLHGGRAVVRSMERVLAGLNGLRSAQAGEFTRRAFANGRMDLNEAEGLSDLLTAETEYQRRAAMQMMGGAFTRAIEEWRTQLLQLSALTEAELDFSDEDDVNPQSKLNITVSCAKIQQEIEGLLAAPHAEKLRDGLRVVLGGPPNSGKSTLLNAIAARDAAIVSDIAGTTRDVIEVPLVLSGIPMIFTDTAGVRDDSNDAIEAIGISRARQAFAAADIILWLGEEGAGPDHNGLIEISAKADIAAPKPLKSNAAMIVSALTGEGMAGLLDVIALRAKDMLGPIDSYAVNARQRTLLAEVSAALAEAGESDDWLITGECLRQARLSLDALTGRAHTEDLLDTVFGKFCIGK